MKIWRSQGARVDETNVMMLKPAKINIVLHNPRVKVKVLFLFFYIFFIIVYRTPIILQYCVYL